jgi:5-dehydro-2-deoxygluconokinase
MVSATAGQAAPATFDVLTMGRVGVDIYPLQVGASLREVQTFGKYLGGSPTNVAVAAARLGRRAALISRTGEDPFGAFVHDALRGYGVDDRYVTAVQGAPTPVTFCEMFPPDRFPLYFYRGPSAPDLQLTAQQLDFDAIRSAGVLWVTVTGLCQEPSRSAVLTAMRARDRSQQLTVLDLDYRPAFWPSRGAARPWVQRALDLASVAVGNLDECETAVGSHGPADAARALRDHGVRLAVVKQGPDGVLAQDDLDTVEIAPLSIDVVNGLGAGDAFGGALCHGLLAGWQLARTMRLANGAGAYVAARLACSEAMPTEIQIQQLLEHEAHV